MKGKKPRRVFVMGVYIFHIDMYDVQKSVTFYGEGWKAPTGVCCAIILWFVMPIT